MDVVCRKGKEELARDEEREDVWRTLVVVRAELSNQSSLLICVGEFVVVL